MPSYDYWITKSFILLADIYLKNNNPIQAKATLQSIIDNSKNAELVTIAHEKMNAIIDSDNIDTKKSQEELEINLNKNHKNDELFQNNNQQAEENKNEK